MRAENDVLISNVVLTQELLRFEVLHVPENSMRAFHEFHHLNAKLHIMYHFHNIRIQKVFDHVLDSNPQVQLYFHFEV